MRVEHLGRNFKLPAECSLLELWELLQKGYRAPAKAKGEVLVRVPLRLVLEEPTRLS